MNTMSDFDPLDPRGGDPGERRDALAAWYQVPVDTFTGFSAAAVDEILDAIRDTPSRWAGIPRTAGQGR
jgi:hypothetical protein